MIVGLQFWKPHSDMGKMLQRRALDDLENGGRGPIEGLTVVSQQHMWLIRLSRGAIRGYQVDLPSQLPIQVLGPTGGLLVLAGVY